MIVRVRPLVFKTCFAFTLIVALSGAATFSRQAPSEERYRIAYQLMMPRPLTHLFEVQVAVEAARPTEFVDFQMPKWAPGRYAVFDFAKNVQEFRAVPTLLLSRTTPSPTDYLPVTRMDNQTWRVETRGTQSVTVSYKVFGDDLSGTFSQLDERHANFNGHSLFMYVVGHKQDPVRLRIDPPQGWRLINGYAERPEQREWQFPNYDILADTPTEIGPDWTVNEFKVDSKTYRVVVHAFGEDGGRRPALVRDIEKIVRAETAMWGAPEFDSYTFLIHFDPDAGSSDAMEHLNSTQIIEAGPLSEEGRYEGALDSAAHEFFHVWNVKRLRPVELGPWDFTKPVNTRGLWIAEGITNYYGHLMQRRAGIWTEEQFLNTLSGVIDIVENAQGSRLMSAEESSILASFLDGAGHEQRTNLANTSINYYPKGEVLGLVLDLLIRGRSRGKASLDDVLRRMYDDFYIKSPNSTYYLRGRGYTNEDFERVASEVAGVDLSDFFTRFVRGQETPPYDEAFAVVGLRLVRSAGRQSFTAGIVLDQRDPQSMRIESVQSGSAAERAGLKQGDVLVSIGKAFVTSASWRGALNIFRQGERVPVSVRRARQTITTSMTLDAPDTYDYRIEEMKGAPLETRTLRTEWLKQESGARRQNPE